MKAHGIAIFSSLFFLIVTTSFAQVKVFTSGQEGYKSFRIPAIVRAGNSDLLAIAEGRINGASDFGDINVVLKRSKDNGKTWSALKVLVDVGELQAGNPAPVLDQFDLLNPQGVLYVFYNTGNNHENEVRKGNGFREVWYIKSVDHGATWTNPVNITKQVHRPKVAGTEYQFAEDWRSYAITPGHAMQFTSGPYRGRIFVPANHSAGEPMKGFAEYRAHGFFTDDHGKSFELAANIEFPGSNESIATEISGGGLLMSIRNQLGNVRSRILAYSSTGGRTWDTTYFEKQLPDAVCQASLVTLGYKKGKAIVASSNAATERKRDSLTIKISKDDGKTWKESILVDASTNGAKDWTAYSDMMILAKRKIGILYERDGYKEIVFKEVRW
jgi:sialidase-1